MSPLSFSPLRVSRVPGMKNLIEEASLHFVLARHPHVVGGPKRLGDLVVAFDVLLIGSKHLRSPLLVVFALAGPERAGEYLAGYVIEKSLSVDNVFGVALIFS